MSNKIKIKITKEGYKSKPEGKYPLIQTELKQCVGEELTYEQLALKIKRGHSFILATYKENSTDISKNDIDYIEYLGLDVDSKENPITLSNFRKMLIDKEGIIPIIMYYTFSATDQTRFRVIYKLERKVSVSEYEDMYRGLLTLYGKYLDNQTGNANRTWCGTNKKVYKSNNEYVILNEVIDHWISLGKVRTSSVPNNTKPAARVVSTTSNNKIFIKKEYREEVMQEILKIPIDALIINHFGGSFKQSGNRLTGPCSIHGGDNPTALTIYKDTNTACCYTHCGSMNSLSVAYSIYKTDDFGELVQELIKDRYISIPYEYFGLTKEVC